MNTDMREELKKALKLLIPGWKMQNNIDDKKSKSIYRLETVDECLKMAEEKNVEEQYVLHRWYNYKTSEECENIFVKCGARKEENKKDSKKDIYINDVQFDVKLTVYPAGLPEHPFDLAKREGKNGMIKWLYANQSQGDRKHLENRFFVVCDADTREERLRLKIDFEQMEEKIAAYFKYLEKNKINELTIKDKGEDFKVKSEVINILKK